MSDPLDPMDVPEPTALSPQRPVPRTLVPAVSLADAADPDDGRDDGSDEAWFDDPEPPATPDLGPSAADLDDVLVIRRPSAGASMALLALGLAVGAAATVTLIATGALDVPVLQTAQFSLDSETFEPLGPTLEQATPVMAPATSAPAKKPAAKRAARKVVTPQPQQTPPTPAPAVLRTAAPPPPPATKLRPRAAPSTTLRAKTPTSQGS